MKISEVMSNPVRQRIVQHIYINKEATPRELLEAMPDVPTATLYRHINCLLDEGILLVKEERKIRGTTERLLAINEESWPASKDDSVAEAAYQFLMSLYFDFKGYEASGRDLAEDRLGFRTAMMSLSDERFDAFLGEYRELVSRYMAQQDGGKLRSVSFVSAPVTEGKE